MKKDDAGVAHQDSLEAVRQTIRTDAERAPPRWVPLLEELEEHIFEASFRLDPCRRSHGLTTTADTRAFEACFGCRPATYVRRLRVVAAQALLAGGERRRWRVAQHTGFRAAESLRWALHQEASLASPPEAAATVARRIEHPPKERRTHPLAQLRSVITGGGPFAQAHQLSAQLAAKAHAASRRRRERHWAGVWWGKLRQILPAQARALLPTLKFTTPVLVELLCEQSRAEGRDDRRRGVEIAELAVAALAPLGEHLSPDELRRWQVKVWACIGNARCLALDLGRAEAAFACADRLADGAEVPAELRAELLCFKSKLRCAQCRPAEAIELADRAVEMLPPPTTGLAAQALLVRAQAHSHLGQDERALPDLHTALDLLSEESDLYLRCAAHQNLAAALWRLGRLGDAETWLARAKPLALALGRREPQCHVVWFEGLLAAERCEPATAKARLRETCEGLREIGKFDSLAVAALDLAQVELRWGSADAAVDRAMEALPHLERLELDSDGLAALALLRQAVAAKQLSATVLAETRRHASRAAGVLPGPMTPAV